MRRTRNGGRLLSLLRLLLLCLLLTFGLGLLLSLGLLLLLELLFLLPSLLLGRSRFLTTLLLPDDVLPDLLTHSVVLTNNLSMIQNKSKHLQIMLSCSLACKQQAGEGWVLNC